MACCCFNNVWEREKSITGQGGSLDIHARFLGFPQCDPQRINAAHLTGANADGLTVFTNTMALPQRVWRCSVQTQVVCLDRARLSLRNNAHILTCWTMLVPILDQETITQRLDKPIAC